MNNLHKVVVRC